MTGLCVCNKTNQRLHCGAVRAYDEAARRNVRGIWLYKRALCIGSDSFSFSDDAHFSLLELQDLKPTRRSQAMDQADTVPSCSRQIDRRSPCKLIIAPPLQLDQLAGFCHLVSASLLSCLISMPLSSCTDKCVAHEPLSAPESACVSASPATVWRV